MTSAEKLADNQESSNIQLLNRFSLLSPTVTCSTVPDNFHPPTGLGLAQALNKIKPMKEKEIILENQGPPTLGWFSDGTISPGFTQADLEGSFYHKPKPMSPGLCCL